MPSWEFIQTMNHTNTVVVNEQRYVSIIAPYLSCFNNFTMYRVSKSMWKLVIGSILHIETMNIRAHIYYFSSHNQFSFTLEICTYTDSCVDQWLSWRTFLLLHSFFVFLSFFKETMTIEFPPLLIIIKISFIWPRASETKNYLSIYGSFNLFIWIFFIALTSRINAIDIYLGSQMYT